MAEQKSAQEKPTVREYIIPLRREWLKAPYYKRSRKAIMAIKKFIAKHMKVTDRNLNNVKLDVYLNNEIWFRGSRKPPAKIKVTAIKEGEIVKVGLAETPEYVRFLKAKHARMHKKEEKKAEEAKPKLEERVEEKRAEVKEEKTEEQKKDEKEKETSVAELHEKEAKQQAKAQKHIANFDKKKTQPHRMALQK